MIRHNLLMTYRSFLRNKTSFFINLIGLSTGLACVLLIYLWVTDELKVDRFHKNDKHLYQVFQNFSTPSGILTWDYSPGLLAKAMLEDLPEVEASTSTSNKYFHPNGMISDGEDHLQVDGRFGRENYFDIFSYPLLIGNNEQVLASKENIVLSEALALNLFKTTQHIVGKTLTWESDLFKDTFTVSGVFENVPSNSTAQFDFVMHYEKLVEVDEWAGHWSGGYAETYLVLKEGTDQKQFDKKIEKFIQTKAAHLDRFTLFTQQYSQKYLYGNYENGAITEGRIFYVKLFALIGLFILLIACINFMNLSTAQASRKMKEIGVKKSIGASRKELMLQFLSESIIMALLSFVVAIVLVEFVLPQFNEINGKSLELSLGFSFVGTMIGIVLLTGLIAGSYPAFYLSGFDPISVLKGIRNTSLSEHWIRRGLVVFQFCIAIIFIVSVIVVHKQIEYTQTKNLGYDRNNVISFQRGPHDDDPQLFLSELKNIPGVVSTGNMVWNILEAKDNQSGFFWNDRDVDSKFLFHSPRIGYNLIETLGMKMLSGRSYSIDHQDDNRKVIINETARKMMGLEDPIGKDIASGKKPYIVIGVVEDFHYGSIHGKVEPLIFRFREAGQDINVRIQPSTEKATIEQIGKVYSKFHPNKPFEYSFLDTDYQALYQAESRVATLSQYFTFLAIIISCLGLFGLAAFTAERKSKEIGIRKILGASIFGIVGLLSKEFTKMIGIAIFLAVPMSYLIAKSWLNGFAYQIDLQWWFFVLAALIILAIAWTTVTLQTIKAARINPVESLRSE